MSDDDDNIRRAEGPQSSDPVRAAQATVAAPARTAAARKPKVRKLRLFWILFGLGALAIVSTIFGMMMAVASDLPQIENRAEYKHWAPTPTCTTTTGARSASSRRPTTR